MPSQTSLLCGRHGAGGNRGGLGLGCGGCAFLLLKGVLAAAHGGDHAVAELLVHADVDHWVVDGGALGKEGWDGHEDWSKLGTLVCENPPGHAGVGQPAYQEADDHDHHHAGDFPLSPLGGLRLLLGGSSFLHSAEQAAVAEEHDGQRGEEVADEHVDDKGLVVESLGTCVVVDSARALHALGDVTGPADERWHGACGGHEPAKGEAHDGVVLPEAEVADGLADDHPSLNGQNDQRPERYLTAQGGEESFHVAAETSENKVAVHGGVHRRGESSEHHEEVSHSEVEQDVV